MSADCVWITGGSSGIGAALARALATQGRRVVISARRAETLAETAAGQPLITPLALDVTDRAAVAAAVTQIEQEVGPIALAVLNAGTYWPTPAQHFDAAKVDALFAVNVGGTVNCLAALLPLLLARGSGHLAVVASVAGYRGLPAAAAYSGSKAAMIAITESLRLDLPAPAFKIQVINPGFVETPLTAKNDFPMPDIITAGQAAELIVAGLASDRFTISFPRRFALVMRLLRILPDSWYFPLVRKITSA
jgi:NADP-dependent 3-hydroxy acid dehydrogenase YdfG